jgi:tetratricopeptide (TPR) repeat protein
MVRSHAADSAKEKELREKVQAGSQELDDYRLLAKLLGSKGAHEEAAGLYRRALDLPLTHFWKAVLSLELGLLLYDAMGEEQEARPLAQDAVSLFSKEPDSPRVLFGRGSAYALLAHCLWRTENSRAVEAARQALGLLERVIAEAPNLGGIENAYRDSAHLQNLLGKPGSAIPLYKKALQHDLDDADRLSCLTFLSHVLRDAGRFGEAEQAIDDAFRYVGADEGGALPRLHFERGLIRRSTNRSAQAKSSFEQAREALQLPPRRREDPYFLTELHWNLGELHYESTDWREAAEEFREVLKHHPEDDPHHRDALLWLGHCYLATQDYGNARDCYEEVLASPDATEAQIGAARKGVAALPPLPKQRLH